MRITLITGLAFVAMMCAFIVYGVVQTAFGAVVLRDDNRVPLTDGAPCNITTAVTKSVGATDSVEVIASSSLRAYLRIEAQLNPNDQATSTTFLGFAGTEGTSTSGVSLSTTTPVFEAGLNTDFPYMGAVEARTNGSASTSVRVTECNYTSNTF